MRVQSVLGTLLEYVASSMWHMLSAGAVITSRLLLTMGNLTTRWRSYDRGVGGDL